ncbi:DUF2970 domain-containing protein [Solimonas marina]|uniref:DUF2970 domain-containing protein n=1 Tax=Solimonas marina TaxID=2714601 RepID=A0A969WD33_9GAMM|nr:DUF2970 domain-containing protein [Solimonas marina]NKF23793.1 DUF2970 domain-containing protein [Solimonas marina]
MNDGNHDEREVPPRGLTLWQTLQSVTASMFGVQSRRNRERDFTRGKASHFIIIGLLAVIAFVLVLVAIVQLLLRHAGM